MTTNHLPTREPITAETRLYERPDGTPTTQAEGNAPLPTRAERDALFGAERIGANKEDQNELRVERPDLLFHELYPGVYGMEEHHPWGISIPVIVAQPEGQGNVSRYLDQLPQDQLIVVPEPIHSSKLRAMLTRRGFRPAILPVLNLGPWSLLLRQPSAPPNKPDEEFVPSPSAP